MCLSPFHIFPVTFTFSAGRGRNSECRTLQYSNSCVLLFRSLVLILSSFSYCFTSLWSPRPFLSVVDLLVSVSYLESEQWRPVVFLVRLFLMARGLFLMARGLFLMARGLFLMARGLFLMARGLFLMARGLFLMARGLHLHLLMVHSVYHSDFGLDLHFKIVDCPRFLDRFFIDSR